MSRPPRLSVGLPVFNGERYLAAALNAILGQSFEDFELIISDNASTDGTASICHRYTQLDSRIRYFRQPRNIGLSPNHNFVAEQANGELFKWAAYDDLYAPDLLEQCVGALGDEPQAVLAHSWTATVDGSDVVRKKLHYTLTTSSPSAPERFKSVLFDNGGDDIYGVVRRNVLRRVLPEGSHHHADRSFVAALVLQGPFLQVRNWLYFRRDHPERAERAFPSVRARCANMDPRRAAPVKNLAVRLYAEYVWALYAAIGRAPLSREDRRLCHRYLAQWVTSRLRPRHDERQAGVVGIGSPLGIGPVATEQGGQIS